jgi:hypothetical protein
MIALGFSVYQFIATPEGPQFYILELDDIIYLDRYSAYEYLNELNITYTTEVGDSVRLEFSCRVYLESFGGTTLRFNFENNGSYIPPGIYLSSASDLRTSAYMTYTFEATTAGENNVVIVKACYDEVDNNIRDCLLTVTVY